MKDIIKRMPGLGTVLVAALFFLSAPVFSQDMAADIETGVPSVEEATLITASAEVAAIDYDTREVTLVDEDGNEMVIVASDDIERLDEVEVGDVIEVAYYLSALFELRNPTDEELANPLQVTAGVEINDIDYAPGGEAVEIITAVCTIEGLDRPSETITLMGPLGGLNVVQVANVDNMPLLNIGDYVVVTFTQSVAISLEEVGNG